MKNKNGSITKQIRLEDGALKKDSSKCRVSDGEVRKVIQRVNKFGDYLKNSGKDTAIILGVVKGNDDHYKIITQKKFTNIKMINISIF